MGLGVRRFVCMVSSRDAMLRERSKGLNADSSSER